MEKITENSDPGNSPECSICIANFNGEALLRGCLDSVFGQQCDFPFEVIVHDDASQDHSVRLIRSSYPGCRLILSSENVGYCESNNRLVQAARGRYVLLLNNDAELFPNALSALCNFEVFSNDYLILGLPQYDYDSGNLIDRGSFVDLFLNPVPNLDKDRIDVAMVIGACLWLPKPLWDELGGFPRWFESMAEDLYLCTLARLRGVAVRVPKESGYRHRYGASFGGGKVVAGSLDTTLTRRRLSERNKTFTMIICFPAPWVYLVLPVHLAALIFEGAALSVLKKDIEIWRTIYWNCLKAIWIDRRRLWKSRKHVQKQRKISSSRFFSLTRIWPRKLEMLLKYGMPTIR